MHFRPRILVVENGPTAVELSTALSDEGFATEVVSHADAAMALLLEHSYDLVIASLEAEGGGGADLVRMVRESRPEAEVIAMTSQPHIGAVFEVLNLGVCDVWAKPLVSPQETLARVRRVFDKRRIVADNQRFIEYLSQANNQIEEQNRELERRVEERTRELAAANSRLEQLTYIDDVTGLYNQRFLFSRLDEEFRRAKRHQESLSVLMIDVDNFKNVNDTHDHLFGSRVLRRLGEVLLECVRNVDFVVRYGGDEYSVVMPHTALSEGIMVAERLRSTVQQAILGDEGESCQVTISIGVASLEEGNIDSARNLLRAADKALYLAKGSGRNRVAVMRGERAMSVVAGLR